MAAALSAVEGQFFPVLGEKILAEKLSNELEEITEAAEDRVVAADTVGSLANVDNVHPADRNHQPQQPERKNEGEGVQKTGGKVFQGFHALPFFCAGLMVRYLPRVEQWP